MGSWPVIIHNSLVGHEIYNLLQEKSFKLRASEGVVEDSVIFPMSGVAFLLITLTDSVTEDNSKLTDILVDRLDRLVGIHRKAYALCQSPLHGPSERHIYSLIQQRYLHTSLQMMPVHNANEALKCMVTTAKVLCKPANELLWSRLDDVTEELMDRPDTMVTAMRHLGLSSHDSILIQDRLGSFSKLATATREELLDCSLDTQTVEHLMAVFKPPAEEVNVTM